MYFWVGVPTIYKEEAPAAKNPHFFEDPSRSIAKIHITAFYFVPKNRKERVFAGWEQFFEEKLKKLEIFHKLQLGVRSQIEYEINPEIIFGFEDNLTYDTDVTQHGNPEALKRILAEIEGRGFWNPPKDDEHRVALIVYEGVGASGADGVALVSRVFLTDPRYQDNGATILAHEFYHTLGLPDDYDLTTAVAFSEDIMGLGRERQLEKTFIKKDFLKKLGI